MRCRNFNLVLGLGCLLGSLTLAQTIRTSHAAGVDFSKFHTYKWVVIKGAHPDPTVDAQIKESIDSQMAAKGLTRAEEIADLSIDYQTAISKAETWQVYEDWGSAALLDGRIPQRKKVTINVGTLVVDIYDTALKQLVWTGRANKTIDPNSDRDTRKKALDKAAKSLLNDFPPK